MKTTGNLIGQTDRLVSSPARERDEFYSHSVARVLFADPDHGTDNASSNIRRGLPGGKTPPADPQTLHRVRSAGVINVSGISAPAGCVSVETPPLTQRDTAEPADVRQWRSWSIRIVRADFHREEEARIT